MMPFGMSLGGGHHLFQPSSSNGALRSNSSSHNSSSSSQRHLRRLTAAAAAATAGAAGVQLYRTGRLPLLPQKPTTSPHHLQQRGALLQIPRELAEVICGAVGEIVQVAVLYPLDTIKVRCQAGGLPVSAVLQQLLGQGSSPPALMRQLYAGVLSASLASVAVGSLYYFTFCAAKRASTRWVAKAEMASKAAAGPAGVATNSSSSSSTAALHVATSSKDGSSSHSSSASGSPRQYPHGSGQDMHGFDPVFAAICSDDKAAAAAAAAASTAASSTSSNSSSSSQPELSSNGKLQANILAACAAAVVGALVEAPVELFKHRAQAGQIQGPMMAHVVSELKRYGPAALYGSFFIPFLFKSLPFDVGELMTYSSLNDWRAAAQQQSKGGAAAAAAAASKPPAVLAGSSPVAAPAVQYSSSGALAAAAADSQTQQQQVFHAMPALASLTVAGAGSSGSNGGSIGGSSGGSSGGLPWPASAATDMPDHVWDMAVGAAAGAAAVLVSMPPDCIKTVMETGGGVKAAAGGGPLRSAAAFAGTGRMLLQQHGPKGLMMGLGPRLVESVPSTVLYWLAVEGCKRLLEPCIAPEASPQPVVGAAAIHSS